MIHWSKYKLFVIFALLAHCFTEAVGVALLAMNQCFDVALIFATYPLICFLFYLAFWKIIVKDGGRRFIPTITLYLMHYVAPFTFFVLFLNYHCIVERRLPSEFLQVTVVAVEIVVVVLEHLVTTGYKREQQQMARQRRIVADDNIGLSARQPWFFSDNVLLCNIALALLECNVAPYVALDIIDFYAAGIDSNLRFETAAAHDHYKKIRRIEAIQRRG